MPSRTEVIERLRAESQRRTNGVELNALITEAADLLEAGESRTEYRVVGTGRKHGREVVFGGAPLTLQRARETKRSWLLRECANVGTARIQRSEVTRTPWTDLEEAGDA